MKKAGRPTLPKSDRLVVYPVRLPPHVIIGLGMMEDALNVPDSEIARKLLKHMVDKWHNGSEEDAREIITILKPEIPGH